MATNNLTNNSTNTPTNQAAGNEIQKPAMNPASTGSNSGDQTHKSREHLSEMADKGSGRMAGPAAQDHSMKAKSAGSEPGKD